MLRIDPDTIYERAEIRDSFPGLDGDTLTRTLTAWGARRPYQGSRKLFISGRQILTAIEGTPPPAEPLPIADCDRRDSSLHPRDQKSTIVPRRRVPRAGAGS